MNIKKYLKIISIILIISITSFICYIHHTLKDKPYDELYLTATQNSNFEGYPKLPNIIYKIYVNNFRGNKQDLLSLYPDPITWFISSDDDIKTKKQNIEKALNKGISINIRSKNDLNMTPLYSAILQQEEELMHFLVDKGADLNAKDFKQKTPIELAEFLLESAKQTNKNATFTEKEKKEFMEDRKNRQEIFIRMIKYLEEQQKANNLK